MARFRLSTKRLGCSSCTVFTATLASVSISMRHQYDIQKTYTGSGRINLANRCITLLVAGAFPLPPPFEEEAAAVLAVKVSAAAAEDVA